MSELDTLCVELTLRCPLRCEHCSANAAPERHEMMDAGLLIDRVRELHGLHAVYLSVANRSNTQAWRKLPGALLTLQVRW
jgi:hypothetical protein